MQNFFTQDESRLASPELRASLPPAFSSNHDAQQLRLVMDLLQRGGKPPKGMSEEMDRLSDIVTRGIRKGKFTMNYVAPRDGSVTLPTTDHETYLQALMYWCAELAAPIPRVMEACARLGDGASVREVQRVIEQIDMENDTMRTTTFFIESGQH